MSDSPCNRIVVIGASAGGVEALTSIMQALPADLPAAVLIVLHTSPTGAGRLPAVLQRSTQLPVAHAVDGESLRARHVYVAPPDHHLLLDDSKIRVTRGPKENHTRPAIDPLFRSAARAYGTRVIAVVLTGVLDDGSAGMCDVKERGGVALVQDPQDAMFPDMPRNAIERNAVDHVLPVEEIPAMITRLVTETPEPREGASVSRQLEIETRIALEQNPMDAGVLELGPVSPYTCPECHGVLLHVGATESYRFRCHTGHAFSIDTLLETQSLSADEALWNAVRAIEEKMMLMGALIDTARHEGRGEAAKEWQRRADAVRAHAESVRQLALKQGSGLDSGESAAP